VAIVERLLPRHWDGRRLLQFLTGLALLALAFAGPGAAVAAPASPARVASLVSPASTGADAAAGSAVTGNRVSLVGGRGPAADAPGEARAAAPAAASDQAAMAVSVPFAGRVEVAFVPVARPVEESGFAEGVSQSAWGSRGPPRA